EERLAVGAVDHRRESGPRPEVRRGPLPHVADHLLGAVGRRALRVGADRGGPQAEPAEGGQLRGGRQRSPRPAPPCPAPPAPPPPTSVGSGAPARAANASAP